LTPLVFPIHILTFSCIVAVLQPTEFRKTVHKFIESRDVGEGGDYWPIVKHVSIRLPNCNVCSSGAILVDLPGVGDSNAARDKIAKDVSFLSVFLY